MNLNGGNPCAFFLHTLVHNHKAKFQTCGRLWSSWEALFFHRSHAWLVHFSMSMPNDQQNSHKTEMFHAKLMLFNDQLKTYMKTSIQNCHGYRQMSSLCDVKQPLWCPGVWQSWALEVHGWWSPGWILRGFSPSFSWQSDISRDQTAMDKWTWKPNKVISWCFFVAVFHMDLAHRSLSRIFFLRCHQGLYGGVCGWRDFAGKPRVSLTSSAALANSTSLLLNSCWISGSCLSCLMLPPQSDPESPKSDLFSPFAALICHVLHDQCREYLYSIYTMYLPPFALESSKCRLM